MSNQAVDVEILGKITRVNCPEGQKDSLVNAAMDLDQRLKEMAERTKVTNEVKLLTIAALNISYELNEAKLEQSDNQKMQQRMEQLAEALEDALSKVKQG
ncbi:MAG: cell division protein ZapA [Vibrio sp.]